MTSRSLWVGLAAALTAAGGCTSHALDSAPMGPTVTATVTQKVNDNLDLLFVIDNSPSMKSMQLKLSAQLPAFMQVLEGLPNGLPNLHIAVVSSDMGAPGDLSSQIGCTQTGDAGKFQYMPGLAATCTSTTIHGGDTFISDVCEKKNFIDPIDSVFQCIAQLGDQGCGFQQPLASIDRALGADGAAPPAVNANFLRPDAYLGIVILTNEDDCSAPPDSTIYSLNNYPQSLTNPDGPVARYRCNGGPRGAHLCKESATGEVIVPPLNPPSEATGSPPILNLTDCEDNATGSSALTPVSKFVSDIKKLKADPDNQIAVAAIIGPPTPYGVAWVAPSNPPPEASGELWPEVMHSCGSSRGDDVNPMATQTATDGSFGDPGVRINQFVTSFPNSDISSICDPSYAQALAPFATHLGSLLKPTCIQGMLRKNSQGSPVCTVTNHLTDASGNRVEAAVPSCAQSGGAPCWALQEDPGGCPAGGLALKLQQDPASLCANSLNTTIVCSLCPPGSTEPGC